MEILEKVLLKDWTWWKIGGPAEYFCLPTTIEEVRQAVELAYAKNWPITVLGGGTNVLVGDKGIEGLVLCTRKLVGTEVKEADGRLHITALAGTPKSELTKQFLRRKVAPALFMCGLPGDIGGGVAMNAGIGEKVSPREFVEITDWIEVIELNGENKNIRKILRDELKWEYRKCSGWEPGIIVRAGFSCSLEVDEDMPRKVKDATKNRLTRQPLEFPSCGSTFKNPPGHHAGALIEKAGLKGFQIGGAQVSTKHANFIINLGGATADDVRKIMKHIQETVLVESNILLTPEVKLLGKF